MVRSYEPEPVPREAIERIVRSVRRGPSAGFSQGLRLVIVTEAERRHRLAEIVGEVSWVENAPALVVVCVREDDYHDRYRRPDKLALTGGVEIACCITIGRAADDDEASALSSRLTRRRRAQDEIVRWERWSR